MRTHEIPQKDPQKDKLDDAVREKDLETSVTWGANNLQKSKDYIDTLKQGLGEIKDPNERKRSELEIAREEEGLRAKTANVKKNMREEIGKEEEAA